MVADTAHATHSKKGLLLKILCQGGKSSWIPNSRMLFYGPSRMAAGSYCFAFLIAAPLSMLWFLSIWSIISHVTEAPCSHSGMDLLEPWWTVQESRQCIFLWQRNWQCDFTLLMHQSTSITIHLLHFITSRSNIHLGCPISECVQLVIFAFFQIKSPSQTNFIIQLK